MQIQHVIEFLACAPGNTCVPEAGSNLNLMLWGATGSVRRAAGDETVPFCERVMPTSQMAELLRHPTAGEAAGAGHLGGDRCIAGLPGQGGPAAAAVRVLRR